MSFLDYIIHRTPERQREVRDDVLSGRIPRWIAGCPRAVYIGQVIVSAPPWVSREDLRAINDQRKQVEAASGEAYHVDHEIPLRHPLVCGLTVPWNLRIVPAVVNMSKGARWCPYQMEFDFEEERV